MKKKILAIAAAVATLPAAYAVDFKAGDWNMSLGGNINAYYTGAHCTGGVVAGGLANKADACGGKENATTIGNGLLPSMLNVGAKTNQNGYDIGAVIGIGVATATNSAIASNSAVDVRNAYVTFGNKDMGTIKMGRDYGLFGLTPVLNDMTLLGVGAAYKATQNGRVSLGHIGAGYTYAGTYGQMAYTTPTFGNGVSIDLGLMNPVEGAVASGSGPQLQARATYAGQSFKAWVAQKNQSYTGYNMNASEVGVTTSVGPVGLLANYQSGNAVGMLSDADQGNIKAKNTFVQATYKATDKLKLGVSSGTSKNSSGAASTSLLSNQHTATGAYYSLTPSLTLVGEIGNTTSKTFGGTEAKQTSYSVGGIFFF
mgnify:CR=1 FL=1|jgi:predicted porin